MLVVISNAVKVESVPLNFSQSDPPAGASPGSQSAARRFRLPNALELSRVRRGRLQLKTTPLHEY
jgi:hypothetical protein